MMMRVSSISPVTAAKLASFNGCLQKIQSLQCDRENLLMDGHIFIQKRTSKIKFMWAQWLRVFDM
jgi:hypothetical protein